MEKPFQIRLNDPEKEQTRDILVKGIEEEMNGTKHLVGVQFRSSLEADTIDIATSVSKNDFEFLASIISFVTGVSAAPVLPYVIHSNDDNVHTHSFKQFIPLRAPIWGIGDVEPSDIMKIISGYNKLQDPAVSKRIVSSLKFYRRAQSTQDPIERFLLLWISIEYMDYIFVKRMDTPPQRLCSKCGAVLECGKCRRKAEVPTTAGLKEFAKRVGSQTETNIEKSIDLRNRLVHRETDMARAMIEADSLNQFLKEFYISIIRELLALDAELVISSKFVHTVESLLVVSATIKLKEKGKLSGDENRIPHYELRDEIMDSIIRDGGTLTEKHEVQLDAVNFPEGFQGRLDVEMLTIGVRPSMSDSSQS